MHDRMLTVGLLLLLGSSGANAGNVMEMLTRDMNGQSVDRMVLYAEPDRSRMDQEGSSGSYSVIFLNDEFIFLDHAEQNYMVMDEAMLEGIGTQISEAMKEMEAQLAALPPEQRAMVEEMLKNEMPGMGMAGDAPVLEIRKTGKGSWQQWDCSMADMLENGVKIQELCIVDFDEVDASGEVRKSWIRTSKLLSKLFDAMPFPKEGVSSPMEMLNRMDGFPVRAVELENGKPVRETILESSEETSIEPTVFELPDGYSRMDPFSP